MTDCPRLSVVAISKDEERDLPGMIENFLSWADELVLVDDGSTDDTLRIAAEAGPRVVVVSSERGADEGFGSQRNKGIDAATGDWCLHVDVDMRTSPELAAEIVAAVRDEGKDAYYFGLRHHFLNRPLLHGGVQHWDKPWLVRRGKGRFEGIVHEELVVDAPAERVGRLSEPMWHLGDADFVERLEKNVRYSALESDKALARGRRASLSGAFLRGLAATYACYVRHRGYRDGRYGLFWALYVFAGTINRELMLYDRQEPAARESIEDELSRRMRAALGQGALRPAGEPG